MMNTTLHRWNDADRAEAIGEATAWCGCRRWAERVVRSRPLGHIAAVHAAADVAFDSLDRDGWLESFAAHPMIGDLRSLRMKFTGNDRWSAGEQSGVSAADEATIAELARCNQLYLDRFGHIFIVCATGLSASEMLRRIEQRLVNPADVELPIAAAEQRKITHLRIKKWLQAK